jgi:uncharacterized protein YuzE
MKSTYDKEIDAMYIYIKPIKAKVFKTIPINDRVIIDMDEKGTIIGIELLDASQQVSQEFIDSSIQLGKRKELVVEV